MPLTGKERAALRAEANRLEARVQVGQGGVTAALVQTLDDALSTRELVKVQLIRGAPLSAGDAADELAGATGAEVIQVIGRTTTLYRQNPALERTTGGPPPWRA